MKKSVKVLFTTFLLVVAFVTPVFATEADLSAEVKLLHDRSDVVAKAMSTTLQYDNNCGDAAKASFNTIVKYVRSDVKSSAITEQQNYIKYLQACVGNAIETERIKKGNVDALKDLVKVNPTFQPQLDAAIVEYNNAVAAHAAANNAIIEAQNVFLQYKDMIVTEVEGMAAADPDAAK